MRVLNRRSVQGEIVRARLEALAAELARSPEAGDPSSLVTEAMPGDIPAIGAPDAPTGGTPVPARGTPGALQGPRDSSRASSPGAPDACETRDAARIPRSGDPEDQGDPEDSTAPRRATAHLTAGDAARQVWTFTRAHAAVIGVIGLVALVGLIWTLTQARSQPVAVATPTPVEASLVPTTTPAPTVEPLRVHVVGAVASPGVVRLPPGARVEDALTAAGGLAEGARPGDLNLAAPVADGAQIVVGDASDPGGAVRSAGVSGGDTATAGATSATQATVDLNAATAEQLDALPGVGPVTAAAILAWRTEHGRFTSVDELLEVDGIGSVTLQRLRSHVRV